MTTLNEMGLRSDPKSKPSQDFEDKLDVVVEEDGADLAERGEVPEVTVTTPPSPPGPTWH